MARRGGRLPVPPAPQQLPDEEQEPQVPNVDVFDPAHLPPVVAAGMAAPPPVAMAGPAGFSMTPFGANHVDMNTDAGRKLYQMATAPLGETKFDGSPHNVSSFLDKLKERTMTNNCSEIFSIGYLTLFAHYAQITVDEVRAAAIVRHSVNNWQKQSSYWVGLAISGSITDEVRSSIIHFREKYEIAGYVDGPTLLRVLLEAAHIDTTATAFNIRNNLSTITLAAFDNDVKRLNEHVRQQIFTLQARGETNGTEIGHILIKAYATSENESFLGRIDRIKDCELPPWPSLMKLAESKYQELLDTKQWNVPNSKQLILALSAKNKKLKASFSSSSKKNNNGRDAKEASKPSRKNAKKSAKREYTPPIVHPWQKVKPTGKTPTTKVVKNVTYHWCEHHDKDGRWVTHNPKNCYTKMRRHNDKKTSKKVTVTANNVTVGNSNDSDSKSESSNE